MNPSPDHAACIAMGANLGDREAQIHAALAELERRPDVRIERVSSLFDTAPVGGPVDQPRYLNGAALLRTSLPPRALLDELLSIERRLGRDRSSNTRNAPRTLDLDLLLYDGVVITEPDLVVPHPRLHERMFVLEPLAEVAPDFIHPVLKTSIRELLARCRNSTNGWRSLE